VALSDTRGQERIAAVGDAGGEAVGARHGDGAIGTLARGPDSAFKARRAARARGSHAAIAR
jgi:hypothetical protein